MTRCKYYCEKCKDYVNVWTNTSIAVEGVILKTRRCQKCGKLIVKTRSIFESKFGYEVKK